MDAIGNRLKRIKSKSKYSFDSICVYLIFALINIAYFPGIIQKPAYAYVTLPLYLLIALLFIRNVAQYSRIVLKTFFIYTAFALMVSAIVYLFAEAFPFTATRNVYMAMLIFFVGYTFKYKNSSFLNTALIVFVISALCMGIISVIQQAGGFRITETYEMRIKNSSGALLGTASCIMLYFAVSTSKITLKIASITIWCVIIACILTFQCRTAFFASTSILIVYLANKHTIRQLTSNTVYLFGILSIIVALIAFDLIPFDFIYKSIVNERDINDANSISSGRLEQIEYGLNLFYKDVLFGASADDIRIKLIDCMPVFAIAEFGLLGSLVIIPIYIAIWIVSVYGCIKAQPIRILPYSVMLFLCITSLSESTFPFGPGTPVICGFFMLGIALSNTPSALFNYNRDVLHKHL